MTSSLFDLTRRSIWVFGGAGYLGRAVIHTLVQQNASVVCIDLPGLAERATQEQEWSGCVKTASLDLTQTGEVKAWIQKQYKQRNAPDGVVFLTTPLSSTPLEEMTLEEFDQYNHGGLTSLFSAVRDVGIEMVRRKIGSIVFFGSMYGMVSPDPGVYDPPMKPNALQYGMQKAAIQQMTRYLAVVWGRHNVRCNCIVPGPFPNPEVQKNHPHFVKKLSEKVPMGRIGQSEEIAGAVAFLLSDAATYVNGHSLVVDGGWTIW